MYIYNICIYIHNIYICMYIYIYIYTALDNDAIVPSTSNHDQCIHSHALSWWAVIIFLYLWYNLCEQHGQSGITINYQTAGCRASLPPPCCCCSQSCENGHFVAKLMSQSGYLCYSFITWSCGCRPQCFRRNKEAIRFWKQLQSGIAKGHIKNKEYITNWHPCCLLGNIDNQIHSGKHFVPDHQRLINLMWPK